VGFLAHPTPDLSISTVGALPDHSQRLTLSAPTLPSPPAQVRYHKHGHPSAVLQVESVTLDTASVGARDVLVRMVCAPLTALDVAAVTGFGGRAPAFPRVGGNEGLGVVEQAGASSGLAKGDVVVATAPGVGEFSVLALPCVEATALARPLARPSTRPPVRPPSLPRPPAYPLSPSSYSSLSPSPVQARGART
jgi:hypothetical protein